MGHNAKQVAGKDKDIHYHHILTNTPLTQNHRPSKLIAYLANGFKL